MTRMPTTLTVLALTSAIAAGPLAAQVRVGPQTYAVTLRNLDTRPASASAARRTLARVEEAALTVCGVPHGALTEVRRAARKSKCWQDSVDQAVAAIGDPLLSRIHLRRP